MKYVKTFEQHSNIEMTNEEFLGFGKKTYILSDDEFKPSADSLTHIKYDKDKKSAIFVHPASKGAMADFKNLYKKKFNQDLSSELAVKCVQAAYMFGGGAPMLSKYGFEFNPKNDKEGGKITLTIDPNGKGLFSGHPIMG